MTFSGRAGACDASVLDRPRAAQNALAFYKCPLHRCHCLQLYMSSCAFTAEKLVAHLCSSDGDDDDVEERWREFELQFKQRVMWRAVDRGHGVAVDPRRAVVARGWRGGAGARLR